MWGGYKKTAPMLEINKDWMRADLTPEKMSVLITSISHEIGHAVETYLGISDISEAFITKRAKGIANSEGNIFTETLYNVDYPREYAGLSVRRPLKSSELGNRESLYTELVSVLSESLITGGKLDRAPQEYREYLAGVILQVRNSTNDKFNVPHNNIVEETGDTLISLEDAYKSTLKDLSPTEQSLNLQRGLFKEDSVPNNTGSGIKGTIPPSKFKDGLSEVWNHGTRLDNKTPINSIDPIKGGSPSEFGLGVYLTSSKDVADAAARKFDPTNRPMILTKQGGAEVRKVNTSRLENVLDLNETPSATITNTFKLAAFRATNGNSSFAKSAFSNSKDIGSMWNRFREDYLNFFKQSASELEVRKFQQEVSNMLLDLGVDGGYYSKGGIDTFVVYNNKKLIDNGGVKIKATNSIEEAFESQRFLDKVTETQLGDNVSKANYLQSKRNLVDWVLNTTNRRLAENYAQVIKNTEILEDTEYLLRKGVEEDKLKRITDVEVNSPTRVLDDFGQDVKKANNTPCLPLPSNYA
jgi:hypothetical protein